MGLRPAGTMDKVRDSLITLTGLVYTHVGTSFGPYDQEHLYTPVMVNHTVRESVTYSERMRTDYTNLNENDYAARINERSSYEDGLGNENRQARVNFLGWCWHLTLWLHMSIIKVGIQGIANHEPLHFLSSQPIHGMWKRKGLHFSKEGHPIIIGHIGITNSIEATLAIVSLVCLLNKTQMGIMNKGSINICLKGLWG